MVSYQNGNALILIDHFGTRIIEYEDDLCLDYPLNIDIRVMNKCSFGYNPKTGSAFCSFCHESARTDGAECDYEALKLKLNKLPSGIELAIGANEVTKKLIDFISWANSKNFICNLTVNQGHLKRDLNDLKYLINKDLIKGLGVSYRSKLKWNVPMFILNYEHTVFHVIAGIDNILDVLSLKDRGVKKILILGEKNFGFNQGNVDLNSKSHRTWYYWVLRCINTFDVVSFDNLALKQLNIKRLFLISKDYDVFDQGEHSFYINAVDQTLAPSSRSNEIISWDSFTLKEYFSEFVNTR